jgi:hypothetical protein
LERQPQRHHRSLPAHVRGSRHGSAGGHPPS